MPAKASNRANDSAPVVGRGEDAEDCPRHQHIVEMRHHKIGVVVLENRPVPAKGANAAEFDVFRAQVTRNINTLQSQIQNLQKQISAKP